MKIKCLFCSKSIPAEDAENDFMLSCGCSFARMLKPSIEMVQQGSKKDGEDMQLVPFVKFSGYGITVIRPHPAPEARALWFKQVMDLYVRPTLRQRVALEKARLIEKHGDWRDVMRDAVKNYQPGSDTGMPSTSFDKYGRQLSKRISPADYADRLLPHQTHRLADYAKADAEATKKAYDAAQPLVELAEGQVWESASIRRTIISITSGGITSGGWVTYGLHELSRKKQITTTKMTTVLEFQIWVQKRSAVEMVPVVNLGQVWRPKNPAQYRPRDVEGIDVHSNGVVEITFRMLTLGVDSVKNTLQDFIKWIALAEATPDVGPIVYEPRK